MVNQSMFRAACISLSLISTTLLAAIDSSLIGDMSRDELFHHHPKFKENFNSYKVSDANALFELQGTKIKILFGAWCHDSEREVPRILKILEELNFPQKNISLIGLDLSKNEPMNRGLELRITNTPTIIFFRKDKEIGRIEESPKLSIEGVGNISITLEDNILLILEN